jgi:hypothetical protein
MDAFLTDLSENFAALLVWGGGIATAALLVFYLIKRNAHVKKLRAEIHDSIDLPGKVKQLLGKALNTNTAEVTAIGTVTLVDLAWQYSMADPSVWDSLDGAFADRLQDAFQNMDILGAALGDKPVDVFENVFDFLKGLEATGLFHDILNAVGVESTDVASSVVLDAPQDSLVDTLASGASEGGGSGLFTHIPLVTLGFASYRAWRRAQKGTSLGRNMEFATIEVTTRAGGGLLGSQIGGAIGSLIAPGPGTIIGGVAGAVAGAVGGAVLGENIKVHHVKKAQKELDESLTRLGAYYLTDDAHFDALREVFISQERDYIANMKETRRKLRHYSMPWRLAWPDHKLILLQETYKTAEERLDAIKQGTVEAIDRLQFMRDDAQYRKLGAILYSDNALADKVGADAEMLAQVSSISEKLRSELVHIGKPLPDMAPAS